MAEHSTAALYTALAYHRAWTSDDLDRAMSYIADDIVCDTPAGRLVGAEAFCGLLCPFIQIVTGAELVAAFGDDRTAVMIYDIATVPVENAPSVEYLTVTNGLITRMKIIFDRAPTPPAASWSEHLHLSGTDK